MRTLKMYEVLDLLKVVNDKISEIDKKSPIIESSEYYEYRQLLSAQRIFLKLAKDKGNNSKPILSLFGNTNSYRIYVSSELRSELDRLKADKTNQFVDRLKQVQSNLKRIDKEMELFNKTKTVRVKIYKDLQLIK